VTPPKAFEQQLQRAFDGRLRIRWSIGKKQWQIEQKYQRMHVGRRIDPRDDQAIRAAEGYTLVAQIAPGDRMKCPRCARIIKLPVMKFAETKCECGTTVQASYWRLSESLLEYLRKYDPYRGGIQRLEQELLQAEEQKEKLERRTEQNLAEDVAKDTLTQWFGIQSVGYTGKEFTHGSV